MNAEENKAIDVREALKEAMEDEILHADPETKSSGIDATLDSLGTVDSLASVEDGSLVVVSKQSELSGKVQYKDATPSVDNESKTTTDQARSNTQDGKEDEVKETELGKEVGKCDDKSAISSKRMMENEPAMDQDDVAAKNEEDASVTTDSMNELKTNYELKQSIDETNDTPKVQATEENDSETKTSLAKLRNARSNDDQYAEFEDNDDNKISDKEKHSVDETNDTSKGQTKTDTDSERQAGLAKLRSAQTNDDSYDEYDDYAYYYGPEYKKSRATALEKYEYFWKNRDVYSQWHESVFVVDGIEFKTAEQYMMYKKAELFGDRKIMAKILKCKNPRTIKAYGRKVQNFDEVIWRLTCINIVKAGNMAKFEQNRAMKDELFSTYSKVLVEASPYDKIWGIGLAEDDPLAFNPDTWEGLNLLGFILTEVRDELMCKEGIIKESEVRVYMEELTKKYCEPFFSYENNMVPEAASSVEQQIANSDTNQENNNEPPSTDKERGQSQNEDTTIQQDNTGDERGRDGEMNIEWKGDVENELVNPVDEENGRTGSGIDLKEGHFACDMEEEDGCDNVKVFDESEKDMSKVTQEAKETDHVFEVKEYHDKDTNVNVVSKVAGGDSSVDEPEGQGGKDTDQVMSKQSRMNKDHEKTNKMKKSKKSTVI